VRAASGADGAEHESNDLHLSSSLDERLEACRPTVQMETAFAQLFKTNPFHALKVSREVHGGSQELEAIDGER
jgi:hypothetical protein